MSDLVAEIRSWIGWPEKELDVLLKRAADELEVNRKRCEEINMLACYASEEDTSVQPAALLEIGKLARGEQQPRTTRCKHPPEARDLTFCRICGETL